MFPHPFLPMLLLLTTPTTAQSQTSISTPTSAISIPYRSSSAPFATANLTTHVIQVGDTLGTLKFFPERITAKRGDLLQFQFYPKAHSVVQSSFDSPCIPISNSTTQGFWSGKMPVEMSNTTMPIFTIPVTDDTKPMWFYCATGKHCQNGMVGVVNEPEMANKTLQAYKAQAALVEAALEPDGEPAGEVEVGGEETASGSAAATGPRASVGVEIGEVGGESGAGRVRGFEWGVIVAALGVVVMGW